VHRVARRAARGVHGTAPPVPRHPPLGEAPLPRRAVRPSRPGARTATRWCSRGSTMRYDGRPDDEEARRLAETPSCDVPAALVAGRRLAAHPRARAGPTTSRGSCLRRGPGDLAAGERHASTRGVRGTPTSTTSFRAGRAAARALLDGPFFHRARSRGGGGRARQRAGELERLTLQDRLELLEVLAVRPAHRAGHHRRADQPGRPPALRSVIRVPPRRVLHS
jgi:hypothetical protein